MLGFYFFQDELHFPKAHQQGQGPCSCYLDFRGWLLLVPPFPSSACLELIPQGSNSLFLTIQTIFHIKPRLFVPRPQNYFETLTKMCWLGKLCWSEVKKQLPLAVYPAPCPSSRHLSPNPCSFPANGKWKVLVKLCWSSCQEHVPFWGREPLFREQGRKLEARAQVYLPAFITSTCKAAPSPEGQQGWAPFYSCWDTSFKRKKTPLAWDLWQISGPLGNLSSAQKYSLLLTTTGSLQKNVGIPWPEEEEFCITWGRTALM